MFSIDEAFVQSAAPNSEAMKNGRALVVIGKFISLHFDAHETILFGQCQGSGKHPYNCSCDFARPDQPTHRCTCPSRQFPCKHCLGLMFAYVLKKASFSPAEVPADLAAKREQLVARAERKVEDTAKPKTVNKEALAKKIKAQLDGLDLLEKITLEVTRIGIGNMNAKIAREIEENAKQLGNAYLPGAQSALHRYTKLFNSDGDEKHVRGEAAFSEALDQLSRLHSIVKHGRNYLRKRLEDPDLKPETDSSIAAWLGHAWQLSELKAAGLVQADVELLQLAFNSHDDVARQEIIDTGAWMNLNTGRIHVIKTSGRTKQRNTSRAMTAFFRLLKLKNCVSIPAIPIRAFAGAG